MAVAVFKESQHAIGGNALLDLARHPLAERAIHGGARVRKIIEQKRQVGDIHLRHTIRQITRRLIRHAEHAVFRHPQQVSRLVAEVHDVPHVVYDDILAELFSDGVTKHFHATAARGAGWAITTKGDAYGIAHQRFHGMRRNSNRC